MATTLQMVKGIVMEPLLDALSHLIRLFTSLFISIAYVTISRKVMT